MSEWQPVPGYGARYKINRAGEIRNIEGATLNPWPNVDGYLMVRLTDTKNGKREVLRVHRLVALTFIPNPLGLPYVGHKDHNPGNPRAENLEWCTQAENIAHARSAGRMADDYWTGRRSPNAILSDDAVRLIRKQYAEGLASYKELAQAHDVSKRAIGRIINRETYSDVH